MTAKQVFIFGILSFNAIACSSSEIQESAKDTSGFEHHVFKVSGASREIGVFTPENYSKEKALPLVLVFHGGGGNMRSFAKKTNW